MKRQLVLAVLVFIAMAVLGVNVHAQQETEDQGAGFYVGGHLGAIIEDLEVNGGSLATFNNTGFVIGGVLGYDFGNFRVDGELIFRLNTIDSLGGVSLNPGGFSEEKDSSTYVSSYMVNGYFDLPTEGPLKPYIGGGIGFATVSIDWVTPAFFFSSVPVADDNDSGLAYQFSTGVGYEIDLDREINPITIVVTLGYRYFAIEELQMMFASSSPINPGSPFTIEYQSHEFLIGARVLFH
jgi:opacity protein-like surface antigen